MFEARYKSITQLIRNSGASQVLELASGYSLRGLDLTRDNSLCYVETDLPDVVATKLVLLDEVRRRHDIAPSPLHVVTGADALDVEQLRAATAVFDRSRSLMILCEGLIGYLTSGNRPCCRQRSDADRRVQGWLVDRSGLRLQDRTSEPPTEGSDFARRLPESRSVNSTLQHSRMLMTSRLSWAALRIRDASPQSGRRDAVVLYDRGAELVSGRDRPTATGVARVVHDRRHRRLNGVPAIAGPVLLRGEAEHARRRFVGLLRTVDASGPHIAPGSPVEPPRQLVNEAIPGPEVTSAHEILDARAALAQRRRDYTRSAHARGSQQRRRSAPAPRWRRSMRRLTVAGRRWGWSLRREREIYPGHVVVSIWLESERGGAAKLVVRVRFDDPWLNYGPMITAPPERFAEVFATAPVHAEAGAPPPSSRPWRSAGIRWRAAPSHPRTSKATCSGSPPRRHPPERDHSSHARCGQRVSTARFRAARAWFPVQEDGRAREVPRKCSSEALLRQSQVSPWAAWDGAGMARSGRERRRPSLLRCRGGRARLCGEPVQSGLQVRRGSRTGGVLP